MLVDCAEGARRGRNSPKGVSTSARQREGGVAVRGGVCYNLVIPVCFGRFEFHAEWLRDEP
jgi:hypothetical protein